MSSAPAPIAATSAAPAPEEPPPPLKEPELPEEPGVEAKVVVACCEKLATDRPSPE